MKIIWKFTLIMWLLPAITTAQACCSLQGHFQSAQTDQYPYSLSFSDDNDHSLVLIMQSRQDLVTDAYITEGPGFTASADYAYRAGQMTILGFAMRLTAAHVEEALSFDATQTTIFSAAIDARILFRHSGKSLWLKLALPLFDGYSNSGFPFDISPVANAEIGGSLRFARMSHANTLRVSLVEELGNTNLFRFRHQVFVDYRYTLSAWHTLSPYFSLKNKSGILKSIPSGVYQNSIQETAYDFGIIGAGINWQFKRIPAVIRLDWTLPILKWSADRLPAGFTENPGISLSYAGPIKINKPKRK